MNQSLGMTVCFAVGLVGTMFLRAGSRTSPPEPYAVAAAHTALRSPRNGEDIRQRLTEPYYLTDKRQELERKLRAPLACDFQQTPLKEVLTTLEAQCGVTFRFDEEFLVREWKVDLQAPVTYTRTQTTLKRALQRILPPLELQFEIDEDSLDVRHSDDAHWPLEIRVYPVADFVAQSSHGGDSECRELIRLICESVHVDVWEDVGGPGHISFDRLAKCLMIVQTADVHDAIEDFLIVLRQVRDEIPSLLRVAGGPSEATIRQALETFTRAESDVTRLETELRQTEGVDPPRIVRWHGLGSLDPAPTPTRPPTDLTGLPEANISVVIQARELSKRALRLALQYELKIDKAEKKRQQRFNAPPGTSSSGPTTPSPNP